MKKGNSRAVAWRRHGPTAFLRLKEWWSFEGLDPARRLYFVFLAMSSPISDYVSLTVLDYAGGRRTASEHITRVRMGADPGQLVSAGGDWGDLVFRRDGDDAWVIDVRDGPLRAGLRQVARAPLHENRLLTRRIDYNIAQFPLNAVSGTLDVGEGPLPFEGYGYCENCWGVQTRHSAANWLHFWAEESAGILLDCHYDEGVHHHYAWLWDQGSGRYLATPLFFGYDPRCPRDGWHVRSPQLELEVTPLSHHASTMRIPPLLPYVSIDYHELLVEVRGTASTGTGVVEVEGIGKYDHNFNFW